MRTKATWQNLSFPHSNPVAFNSTVQPVRTLPASLTTPMAPFPQLVTAVEASPALAPRPTMGEMEVWNETGLIHALQGQANSIAIMTHIVLTGTTFLVQSVSVCACTYCGC